jgi:hypothetical protein
MPSVEPYWIGSGALSSTSLLVIIVASDGTKQDHIVFDVDLDGDIDATKTDRELFTISSTTAGSWTDAERLTINDVEDSLPVIVNPNGTAILVWDSNDTLLYTPLINSWNPKQVYSQYTLSNQAATLDGVTMDGGAAIGYTVQTPSGVDIMASFYDVNLDRWSLPRQLTFDEDVESAISLGFDGTRLVVAYLKTETERNEVDAEIEGQIYHLENVPQPGRTDLCLLHHTLGYDFSIDANSIVFEPNENPKPSSNQKIWATVENMGDLSSDVTVEFYDGDPDSGGSLIGNPIIINDLIPGGRYQVSVDWQVPDFSEAHEIYVVVDPDLKVDDRDRSNNVASKFTVLPDMVVVNTWSANLSAHSMMLIARITNIGVSPAKEVTVSWKMDSPQGIEIGRDMITILRPDGAYEASCVWDANAITSGEEYVQIFGHVSASDSAPDVDEDNNIFTLVIKNPRPLNQPPIADAGEDIIAYALVDGLAQVKLDGTGSYDLDADELDHFWYSDVNDLIATGVEPNVILPVGKHIISLVVNDGFFDSEPNDVVITVIEPLEVSLKVTPQTLNCRSKGNWVEAHFKLPESLTATDVDSDKSVMINSWDIESIPLMKIFLNEDGITEITASFDRQAVCSLSDNWPDMLTIFGFLTNGQIFYGNSEIRINPAGLKEMSELASYWLSGCGPPKWCDGLDLNRDTIVNMQDYPLLLNSEVGFSGE